MTFNKHCIITYAFPSNIRDPEIFNLQSVKTPFPNWKTNLNDNTSFKFLLFTLDLSQYFIWIDQDLIEVLICPVDMYTMLWSEYFRMTLALVLSVVFVYLFGFDNMRRHAEGGLTIVRSEISTRDIPPPGNKQWATLNQIRSSSICLCSRTVSVTVYCDYAIIWVLVCLNW